MSERDETPTTNLRKDSGQKNGGQKDGGQKNGGQKDGGQKNGGQKDGGQKNGGQKDGGQKDGGQKDGGQGNRVQENRVHESRGQEDRGQESRGQQDRDQAETPTTRLRRELPEEVPSEFTDALEEPGEPGEPVLTGRQRLLMGLWPPRVTRAQLIVALLLFGLGFGLAVQVASNSDSDSALRGARQADLVRILDELDDRTQRLEEEKQGLEGQRTELENSSDQAEEARKQTVEKERQLGILAGTVAAQGPGITLTINDTKGTVEADMLLDAIQELRAAGAEAIQVNGVRVVAGTYLTDSGKGISVDGNKITQPYRFKVIGKPQDLEPALNIPGGVVQTLEKEQATVIVERTDKIIVDALRAVKRPDYARSSSQ